MKNSEKLLAQKGKFSLWECASTGEGATYEIRRGADRIEEYRDEREALSGLALHDRLEVQGRAFGPGM